jgi:hypothetical protein
MSGQPVKAKDKLMTYLFEQKLAWNQHVDCMAICVHQGNRGGAGVTGPDVHQLADGWLSHGFVAGAMQNEAIQRKPHDRSQYEFNLQMVGHSDGKLAPIAPDNEIRYAAVGGSHGNEVFRAARCGVACDLPKISVDGHMSMERISSIDREWGDALQGIAPVSWVIIDWRVEAACPDVVKLMEKCGNAKANISKLSHEVEHLVAMQDGITQHRKHSANDDNLYDKIVGPMIALRPKCADALEGMHHLTKTRGIGNERVQSLSDFQKQYDTREIGGHVYAAVADVEFDVNNACNGFRFAILKALYSQPTPPRGGQCNWITVADVKSLSWQVKGSQNKKSHRVMTAEALMNECEAIANAHVQLPMDKPILTRVVGLMQCRMVCVVLDKKDKSRRVFKSTTEVASEFIKELSAAKRITLADPWEEKKAAPLSSDGGDGGVALATITDAIDVRTNERAATDKSFVIGGKCGSKADRSSMWTLTKVSDHGAELEDENGLVAKIPIARFLRDWFPKKDAVAPEDRYACTYQ